MKKVLAIAGSDSSGGAGIQADIKTITAHKMYAMSAITALTAQNTMAVFDIMEATADFVAKQLDAVFGDIPPDSVKIGMVSDRDIIKTIAEKLVQYHAKNIVLDPVMVATSGGVLLKNDATDALIQYLLPLCDIVTPNIPEGEILSGISIKTETDLKQGAEIIAQYTKGAVLMKGGHLPKTAKDYLYHQGKGEWFVSERINTTNTHGTGCTLSSAIACNLAEGKTLNESVKYAKEYLTGALRDDLNLGQGSGPINHMYAIEKTF